MTDTAGTTGTTGATGTTVGSNGSGGRAVLLRFWGVRGSIPSPGRLTALRREHFVCLGVDAAIEETEVVLAGASAVNAVGEPGLAVVAV